MSERHSSNASAESGANDSIPALPASFSASDGSDQSACEARRRMIRKIIVGVPTVVAMTARGAVAHDHGGDILAASAPSSPSI